MISGSRGLAETLIRRLLESKFNVSCLVRDQKRLAEVEAWGPVLCEVGDVTSHLTLSTWFQRTLARWERVDCVINNAATQGEVGRLHEVAFDDFEKVIKTNFLAPAFLSQLAVRHYLERGSGTIINVSGGGATHARPRFISYATSKCALVRMTETLAVEYPELSFYAVSPGGLKTAMTQWVVDMGPERAGAEFEEAKRRIAEGGEDPNRAADLVLWLTENRPRALNGKLISAIWDDYRQLSEKDLMDGWWTLRRIDEQCRKRMQDDIKA
jgi:NAD(P)-dependent dehydrogenase (short-subunit alcohol dehydrogenase family)